MTAFECRECGELFDGEAALHIFAKVTECPGCGGNAPDCLGIYLHPLEKEHLKGGTGMLAKIDCFGNHWTLITGQEVVADLFGKVRQG